MPDSAGVGAYSGITLLGVYVCGRIARKCEQSFSFKHGQLVLAGVGSLLICLLGFGSYASPFAVVVAMCLFYLFKQVKQTAKREIFGKMVNLIAPSLFSVYLLHSNVIGFNLIKDVERGGVNPLYCSMIVLATCLLLDVPRRVVVYCVRPLSEKFLRWVDRQWQNLETRLSSALEISGDSK